jgi:hypothetical protein
MRLDTVMNPCFLVFGSNNKHSPNSRKVGFWHHYLGDYHVTQSMIVRSCPYAQAISYVAGVEQDPTRNRHYGMDNVLLQDVEAA